MRKRAVQEASPFLKFHQCCFNLQVGCAVWASCIGVIFSHTTFVTISICRPVYVKNFGQILWQINVLTHEKLSISLPHKRLSHYWLIRADIGFKAPCTHNLVPFSIFLYLCWVPRSQSFIEAGLTWSMQHLVFHLVWMWLYFVLIKLLSWTSCSEPFSDAYKCSLLLFYEKTWWNHP